MAAGSRIRFTSVGSNGRHDPVQTGQVLMSGNPSRRHQAAQQLYGAVDLGWIDLQRNSAPGRQSRWELIDQPGDEVESVLAAIEGKSWLGNEIAVTIDLIRPQIRQIGQDEI